MMMPMTLNELEPAVTYAVSAAGFFLTAWQRLRNCARSEAEALAALKRRQAWAWPALQAVACTVVAAALFLELHPEFLPIVNDGAIRTVETVMTQWWALSVAPIWAWSGPTIRLIALLGGPRPPAPV